MDKQLQMNRFHIHSPHVQALDCDITKLAFVDFDHHNAGYFFVLRPCNALDQDPPLSLLLFH